MRIDTLMLQMSVAEKIGQLNLVSYGKTDTGTEKSVDVEAKIAAGRCGGIFGTHDLEEMRRLQETAVSQSRLGIPLLFGLDVIHGHKTVFPIPLALACSWNLGLIAASARIAATEASAEGVNWVFSPMVDVSRDPRWGRVAEGAGEDAWLGAAIARAMVRALQDEEADPRARVLACVKHMGLYGAVEAGREYNVVDMSPRRMHEHYLPPYKAAVEAGVASVMTAFNDINGIPATADEHMFRELLRGQWGFNGLTVSDYTAINEMTDHGLGNLQDVSVLALKAGIDMDMVGEGYLTTLEASLREGRISETLIDEACRRVLEAKERLGLFDNPFLFVDPDRQKRYVLCADHRAFARAAIPQSCVLLKNDRDTLPLKRSGSIALVGPLADDQRNVLGTWSIAADWTDAVSVLSGMRDVAGDAVTIRHARGANITGNPDIVERANFKVERVINDSRPAQVMIDEAVQAAEMSDVIVAVVGEAQEMSGECASRADIGIPEAQKDLLKALKHTGKPLVLVTFSGRPLTLTWEDANADAILHTWFAGTETGNGIADILFGDASPSGKLTMTFPRHVGQVPIYYNHRPTGRPLPPGKEFEKFRSCYIDVPNSPLYPFGHGLAYTQFDYGPVELEQAHLTGASDTLVASCCVRNSGRRAGAEIVQFYVSDPVASITRPVKALRGFHKIELQPGEEVRVAFAVAMDDLKFYNSDCKLVFEPGEFIAHIGSSSERTKSARFIWTLENSEISGGAPVAAAEGAAQRTAV